METASSSPKQKTCPYCGRTFTPDPRVGDRQKCCEHSACKLARKRQANQNWRRKNPNYFKGRYRSYLKGWLSKHRNYLKDYRRRKKQQAKNDIQDKMLILDIKPFKVKLRDIQDKLNPIFSTDLLLKVDMQVDIQDKIKPSRAFSHAP